MAVTTYAGPARYFTQTESALAAEAARHATALPRRRLSIQATSATLTHYPFDGVPLAASSTSIISRAAYESTREYRGVTAGYVSADYFATLGIPRPLEASLDRNGVGALRTARFRGGITFRERITLWQPNERLGFSIAVVPESIVPGLLDQHVRVGSEHFDVTWGEFRLAAAEPGRTRLVLLSRHRLSTRFNAYAGLWTDAVMRDLQERICEVIARRAEAAAGS